MTAREIMSTQVTTIREDEPARRALEVMAEANVSGLPVVNDTGALVGIITGRDLLFVDRTEPRRVKASLFGLWIAPDRLVEQEALLRGVLVRDLMTRPVISFGPDDSVAEIAQVMYERGINRVPILEDNDLVGIVARADIIRALAEGKSL